MIIDRSAELDQLATALSAAQSVMEGAEKRKQNPAFRSTYADLASVWDAARVALTSNGLAVSQHPGRDAEGTVTVTTVLMHRSGQHLTSICGAVPRDQSAAAVGSVVTYLRRYALASAVGVSPEDDDGQAAGVPPQRPAARPVPEREVPAHLDPAAQPVVRAAQRVADAFGGEVESVERIRPAPSGFDPMCPTCGSTMWDNRPKKASGDMNPKAPDFKCKDKSCQGVIWKHGEKARAPRATAPQVAPPPTDEDGPGFPF